jgi:lysozyme
MSLKPSQNCINLIKRFEGCRLKAYKCPAGVWTIGYGTIRYQDGKPVKEGEEISLYRAETLLTYEVEKFASQIKVNVNQNQFDSLVSFCYNLGIGAFNSSTLKKKIIANPGDLSIRDEFMKWNKARVKGVLTELKGLTNRRKAEADLYFKI